MSENLKSRLQEDMKNAMRNKEKERLGVIRMVNAAIKQREVDERIELDDSQVLAVLEKLVKQRLESVRQYRDAKREDLAEIEENEITVLKEYLPEPMTEEELNALIEQAVVDTGAQSMKDMGKVMAIIKSQAQGRADMAQVSKLIKQKLG